MIGRQAELEALERFVSAVRRGPAGLLIEGPIGIGKTILWNEGLRIAASHGCQTLTARPSEAELPLAFNTLGDLMERVPGDALSALPPAQRRAVENVLMGVHDGEAPLDWRATSLSVLALVRHLTAAGPLVIAVDDLQWLDAPSARVLPFLLRRLTIERLGLLGTIRSGKSTWLRLEGLMADGRITRLTPEPLDAGQLGELVFQRLRTALPMPVLARVHRVCGGNPRWALEIAAEVMRRGRVPPPADAVPVPDGIVELMTPRLAPLPAGARLALATVAALPGATFKTVTAALTSMDAGPATLRLALEAGVLQPSEDRVVCPEAILAATAYQLLTARERRLLHAAIANSAEEPDEQAWHLALARPEADEDLASRLERAGRRAGARGATDAAARISEQAALHTPHEASEAARRRSLQAADRWFEAGDVARCRALLEELARRLPDDEKWSGLYWRLGRTASQDHGWAAARPLFLQAQQRSRRDSPAAARAQLALAWTALGVGRLLEARRRARHAAWLSIRSREPGLRREAVALVAFVDSLLGHPGSIARLEAAGCPDSGGEDGTLQEPPASLLAGALVWQGDMERARSIYHLLHRGAVARGRESSRPLLLWRMAEMECWDGDWLFALRLAEEGHRVALSCGQPALRAALQCVRALAAVHLGRFDDARTWAESGMHEAVRAGDPAAELLGRQVLGLLELWMGNPADAHVHLGTVVARLRDMGAAEPGLYRFLPDEIGALVSLDRLAEAAKLLAWWRQTAIRLGRHWVVVLADRCAGQILSASGDLEGAAAATERAMAGIGRLSPFERGRTHLQLGEVRRRLKQRAAARASLRQAVEVFHDLGAGRWAEWAAGELQRAGDRPASGGLTTTEARVAELAAQGWTNLEIARRLFISTRTVEANLTSVYRKLGVRGRVRLARRLAP